MKSQNRAPVHITIFLGKLVMAFISGGILIHVLIMFLDYSFMTRPLYLNLHENFVGSIFSGPMIPMMVAYGLFTLGIYFLWGKMKKAILLAHQKEIQKKFKPNYRQMASI